MNDRDADGSAPPASIADRSGGNAGTPHTVKSPSGGADSAADSTVRESSDNNSDQSTVVIDAGADMNKQNNLSGATPLHMGTGSTKNPEGVFKCSF